MTRLKSWPVWMLMGVVTVALLAVGSTRDQGPLTQAERIDAIAKRVACPTCDGESVFVSRATAADAIRKQIARDVGAGRLSDSEIIATIAESFDAQVLLVPRATGVDSLVWVLPIAVLVCAVAGLAVAFRRWRTQAALVADDADYTLVDRLLDGRAGAANPHGEDPRDGDNV